MAADTQRVASRQEVRNRQTTPDPLGELKREVWQVAQQVGITTADGLKDDFARECGGQLIDSADETDFSNYLAILKSRMEPAA